MVTEGTGVPCRSEFGLAGVGVGGGWGRLTGEGGTTGGKERVGEKNGGKHREREGGGRESGNFHHQTLSPLLFP